jgi:hypothetical protein
MRPTTLKEAQVRFELVDKEEAHGVIGGSDYGSSIRLMARSPTHVMFNALGGRIWKRGFEGWNSTQQLFHDRAVRAKFERPEVQAAIEKTFGEGAGALILQAWKEGKTLLVDGGGAALTMPGLKLRKLHQARYAEVNANWEADLKGRIPCCKQCGAELKPKTVIHHLGASLKDNHPKTVEECQRLTNLEVVRVHDYGQSSGDKVGHINWFETWDGESVFDPHFCDDKCAAKYGRRAAEACEPLEVGIEPVKHQWTHESVSHYEEKTTLHTLADGTKIRL